MGTRADMALASVGKLGPILHLSAVVTAIVINQSDVH